MRRSPPVSPRSNSSSCAPRSTICPMQRARFARASMGDILDDPNFLELPRFCAAIGRIDELLADCAACAPIGNEAVRAVDAALATGNAHDIGVLSRRCVRGGFAERTRAARPGAGRARRGAGARERRAARELGRDELASDEFIVMRAELHGSFRQAACACCERRRRICFARSNMATRRLPRSNAATPPPIRCRERKRRVRGSPFCDRSRTCSRPRRCGRGARRDSTSCSRRRASRNAHRLRSGNADRGTGARLRAGRFLPLEAELADAGRRFVPLDLELQGAAVLTGPNMGGKSVSPADLRIHRALRRVRSAGAGGKCARPRSSIGSRGSGWGAKREIGGLLSSFAQEVVGAEGDLGARRARLLILADEFARTTTPHEGRALLVALLERLRERGACGSSPRISPESPARPELRTSRCADCAESRAVRRLTICRQALAALAASMDYTIVEVSGDEAAARRRHRVGRPAGLDRELRRRRVSRAVAMN